MGTTVEILAGFVTDLRTGDPPDTVARAATRHVVDAVGVALAAAADGHATPAVEMARSWAGATEASIIGYDDGAPAAAAALVNGALVHALGFDDTHVESVIHPSAAVVPAALAVAEETGARGTDALGAVVAGYEVAARIGAAAPGRFGVRGLEATGICGTFGAAAAAARLWGLTSQETAHALGIAGSAAPVSLASTAEGSQATLLHPGWAAHTGVIAADLARRGLTGPLGIFDEPSGFFGALLHGEEPDLDRLRRGLGSEWEATRIAIKPYPASDFLLALMDAASRATVRWGDIEEVVCCIPPAGVGIVAEPRGPRLQPTTSRAARTSLPFAVAAAIVGGRDPRELFGEDARHDRRILTLAGRVHHEVDPMLPFPRSFGARLRIHTRSGRTLTLDEPINRGHPDRPLTDAELRSKFLSNASSRLGHDGAQRALDVTWNIAHVDDVDQVMSELGTA